MTTTRIAIYTRISRDEAGDQDSTPRQERACRALAQARGWNVAGVFEDVDLSAYDRKTKRPQYEAVLAAVAEHRVDGVLVWKLDRLVRRSAEFERFWSVCEEHSVFLASVTEPIDSSTDFGMALIRVLVTFAALESATKGLRLRAKARERAEAGKRLGGPRPYGHTADMTGVVADEAAVIRFAADSLLDGWSVRRVIRELNARGIPSPRPPSKGWSHYTLRNLLLAHRLVGDGSYHGDVVARGCFAPILDREVGARVRLILSDPASRSQKKPNRYLLAGLLRCGLCGERLVSQTKNGYSCCNQPWGCHRIAISRPPIDAWIRDVVLWRVGLRGATPESDRRPVVDVLDEHGAALLALSRDFYVQRRISRQEYVTCRFELERAAGRAVEVQRPDPTKVRKQWPAMTLAEQRAVVKSELRGAVVDSAPAQGGLFYPQRVRLDWWEPPTEPVPTALMVATNRGGRRPKVP